MSKFVPPKSPPPPDNRGMKSRAPPEGFFSSVFKTRPQLEAEIKTLKTENALLRAHLSTHTIIAADRSRTQADEPPTATEVRVGTRSAPCPQCSKTRDIFADILAKHEGKSYAR